MVSSRPPIPPASTRLDLRAFPSRSGPLKNGVTLGRCGQGATGADRPAVLDLCDESILDFMLLATFSNAATPG